MTLDTGRHRVEFLRSYSHTPVPDFSEDLPLDNKYKFGDVVTSTVLSNLPVRFHPLVRYFVHITLVESRVGGSIQSFSSLHNVATSIRIFVQFLESECGHASVPKALMDLTDRHVIRFAEWLRDKRYRPGSTTASYRFNWFLTLVRAAQAHGLVLSPPLTQLMKSPPSLEHGDSTPRDAYSEAVTQQMRKLMRQYVNKAVKRLTIDGPAELAKGSDPSTNGWISFHNQLWFANAQGILSQKTAYELGGWRAAFLTKGTLQEIHHLLYPSGEDIAAFFTLIALSCGLEPECIVELDSDCLGNATGEHVDINYIKRRAGNAENKVLRVRDGGHNTPGGLIRLLIGLGAKAREKAGTDSLWVYYQNGRLIALPNSTAIAAYIQTIVNESNLVDEDGRPPTIQVSRFRKSFKSPKYLASSGQPDLFAKGHSPQVAARHYANIESHRELHEKTIEDGLKDALEIAKLPTVISPTDESELTKASSRALETGEMSAEQLKTLAGGESDLWLSSCRNFFDSPFGERGHACPVPFFGCLLCPNAVITIRKLPAIIAFLNHIELQRELLSAIEWELKYARAYISITRHILPHFSETDIAAAKVIAASTGLIPVSLAD